MFAFRASPGGAVITRNRPVAIAIVALLLSVFGPLLVGTRQEAATTLPKKLSDRAFWKMITDFSEPGGVFRSENLLSNELTFQEVIPELQKRASRDAVYLGVGPDQNFTYITALRPPMAFIIDIRRQNLIEHLLYKALIEQSSDRIDFLSRLFSRPRPPNLAVTSDPSVILDAYRQATGDELLFQHNMRSVIDRLVTQHGFPLPYEDRQTLEFVYRAFFAEGPELRYSFPRQGGTALFFPTYMQLMTSTDAAGTNHSYLSTEKDFATLREFERNNLLVPLVGDFGGDKAIRAVGKYVREHGGTVGAFYTSNVEQYLFQGDAWQHYYASVATLPLTPASAIIRSFFDIGYFYPPGIVTPDLHSVQLLDPLQPLLKAIDAGEIHSYRELVVRQYTPKTQAVAR
jgi:hypothetical protein